LPDESSSNDRTASKRSLANRAVAWSAAITLPIMGLGNFSEAVILLEEGFDRTVSTFTHFPEYRDLSQLKVGSTIEFADGIFGVPEVRRSLSDGITANYYFTPKYLLTLLVSQGEVHAYTVLSRNESFHPQVFEDAGAEYSVGQVTLSELPGISREFVVDQTKTQQLYIEKLDTGLDSLLSNGYLGWLSYGAGSGPEGQSLGSLYDARMTGKDARLRESKSILRKGTVINFYGRGDLSLAVIRESIFTSAEFDNYVTTY